jgi:universal stress protein A
MELNTLLVPIDFSDTSRSAAEQAVAMAAGDDCAVILMHVIDRAMVEFAQQHNWGTAEGLSTDLRAKAEGELLKLVGLLAKSVEVQTVVCEGTPFVEILRKAEEFQVDAVLMGKHGTRGRAEKLLFGTTAERVIRWSTRPVIVLPPIESPAPSGPPEPPQGEAKSDGE